ncbi:uncharacterized protein METZ01_LOCUS339791, partial [marine metagenome]
VVQHIRDRTSVSVVEAVPAAREFEGG